jgi:Tol biopolymer transport system component
MSNFQISRYIMLVSIILLTMCWTVSSGCTNPVSKTTQSNTVPHDGDWGIYRLDLNNLKTSLVYSTSSELQSSALRLNSTGDRLVFAQKANGTDDTSLEIYTVEVDGNNIKRLTNNADWDLYPVWSPDCRQIAFLSKREKDLDIYIMDSDGTNERKLYDSGYNDADIDWAGSSIVFTSQFAVWRMNTDGTQATQLTDPAGRGEWGKANLPKGDYDPRISHDGKKVVFERLEDANVTNGGYNLFMVNTDRSEEKRLTENGYSQGLASWSHSGAKIVYIIAAINGEGKYDIYTMNADGTNNRNITPAYFPIDFLCYTPIFSADDSNIFFIGRWWK